MVFSYIIKVSYEKNVYADKTFFEYKLKESSVFLFNFLDIITALRSFVKGSVRKNAAAAAAAFMPFLSLAEGLAVRALVLSGICLVGTHQNPIQRAVVLAVAVICALLNGAFDALICVAIHNVLPPSFEFGFSMAFPMGKNRGKIFLFIAIIIPAWYDKENKLMFIAPAWFKSER